MACIFYCDIILDILYLYPFFPYGVNIICTNIFVCVKDANIIHD
jgi:hypothetical protein